MLSIVPFIEMPTFRESFKRTGFQNPPKIKIERNKKISPHFELVSILFVSFKQNIIHMYLIQMLFWEVTIIVIWKI